MPRVAVNDNPRMNSGCDRNKRLRLVRAAALRHTDLTEFVLQPALRSQGGDRGVGTYRLVRT